MADVICINDTFSIELLDDWEKLGVVWPKKDKFYTIRELVINNDGRLGFLLNEIINPPILINCRFLGSITVEPNWDINRFRNLDLSEIDYQAIKEEQKLIKNTLI